MGNKNVVYKKSIQVTNISNEELSVLLSPYVGNRESYDEFKIFRGVAYTNELDRDGEQATHDYLVQLASKLVGVPVIKNHDWYDVDGILGRVIRADVEADGDVELIRILFYVVKPEVVEKIETGLYYGLSVGSNVDVEVNAEGVYLTACNDAYEVSLVTVPAVPGAHITKSKRNGGDSGMDVETLTKENEALKAELETLRVQNAELVAKIAAAEEQEFKDQAEDTLETKANEAADAMDPANDTVKGFIVDELKSVGYEVAESADGATTLKCGKFISFKNFDVAVESVKAKYSSLGLLGKVETKVAPKVETKAKTETKAFDFSAGDVNKKSVNTGKRGMTVNFN